MAALAGLTYGLSAYVTVAADTFPVTLTIENATSADALRCQLVLAHFVTRDLAPIPTRDATTIDMQRTTDGTLFFRSGSRSMATENILCGLDDDWSASRNDLDLQTLRDGSQPALRITCSPIDILTCRVR